MARADAAPVFDRWADRAAAHQQTGRSISAHVDGRRRAFRIGGQTRALRPRSRGGQPQCSYLLSLLPRGNAFRAAAARSKLRVVQLRRRKKCGRLIHHQGTEGIFQVMTNRTDRRLGHNRSRLRTGRGCAGIHHGQELTRSVLSRSDTRQQPVFVTLFIFPPPRAARRGDFL
jgi:hypothetical protein